MRASAILLLSILIFFVSWPTLNSISLHEPFLQCLNNHSDPSYPISSQIYTPENSSYSSVLQSYIRNLRFNTSTTPKPLLILTATHHSHVQAAILCSQKQKLLMKIRSGGHDYEGISYVANVPFFILDMFNLRSIDIDIESETAWIQAGATLGEVYYRIAEKSSTHGFPAGVCPTVGVGGHFSGGGYGNMMRKYGLSVDNIMDAQIVDVTGQLLDRESMGEDLFWAIRGGGGASFGVILSYKVKLVRVPETVTVFRVERTLEENGTELVYKWQQVADKLHEDIFIRLIMTVVNSTQTGEKTIRASFFCLFLGESDRLLSLMNKSFPELGLQKTDCIETSWVRSTLYWYDFPLATTATDVLLDRTPSTLTYLKRKSDYVKEPISKKGLERIWKKMIELETPVLTFNPYGGKMAEILPSETPFPHRAGNLYKIQYAVNWNQGGEEVSDRYINWVRKLYNFMTPFVSKSPREAFLNYRDLDLGVNHQLNAISRYVEGRVYGIKYFKGNFDRLVHVKTRVDPANFFRNEQSIPRLPY